MVTEATSVDILHVDVLNRVIKAISNDGNLTAGLLDVPNLGGNGTASCFNQNHRVLLKEFGECLAALGIVARID